MHVLPSLDTPDINQSNTGYDSWVVFNNDSNHWRTHEKFKKIRFNKPMRTEEVFKLIPDRLNGFVRLPTLTETFRALRYGRPLDNNERVVCLDYHTKIGEDVLIVTAYGPVVMPCLSIWSEDYTFPIITNGT